MSVVEFEGTHIANKPSPSRDFVAGPALSLRERGSKQPLRVAVFTTLFPNPQRPQHGVFVANRLEKLVATGEVQVRVIAPVPYFPSTNPMFGDWARNARVPSISTVRGLSVEHPRYLVVPKFGMRITPSTLAYAARGALLRAQRDLGGIDLIDAHYLYPDGVAAAKLAKWLGVPFVMTARGTDVNLIPKFDGPRRAILEACSQAAGVITVSAALRDELVAMGGPADKIRVLRNGVDLQRFTPPADRARLRAELGAPEKLLLSVGHLIERKGHHLIIDALTQLPDVHLWIAGEGPEHAALEKLARARGVDGRVRLLGAQPHDELKRLYGAADALVLASSREGWANVLLEAMACGTPVIATPIWGNPEVVSRPAAGVLTRDRSAGAIADAASRLLAHLPDRALTRLYAEGFGWEPTTQGQLELFRSAVASRDQH
ncbi:glycosyltransferase family 4 protein [Roseiterribacter gracilis]|uniref:Glycosyl transferase family 1 n=1 Tax=Roseiterribacter gracilis TaxID=2812848 RepID=A0A8S8X5U6_9PROT|nr:glycosyl transferase family 1 [Rhodospirillales bacterium TMPK1]